jgi:hypothetical protein
VGSLVILLSLANLAAEPTYSVVVTRRVGVSPEQGLDLAEMFSVALENQGEKIPGKRVSPRALTTTLAAANQPDTASCAGAIDCAAVLGRLGGVDFLFALQMVKVGANVFSDVTLIRVVDGVAEATGTRPVPLKSPAKALATLAKDMAAKARSMGEPLPKAQAAVAANPAPTDSPVATAAASEPPVSTPPPPPVVVETSPAQPASASVSVSSAPTLGPGRYVAIGLGVVALGAVGTGAYFGVSADSQSTKLSDRSPDFAANQASVLSTARTADVAYGIAGAAAIAAVVVWIVARPASSPVMSSGPTGDSSSLRWDF